MEVLLNEDKLLDNDIHETSLKVRALLFDDNNNVLVANYNGVLMLPGGKVDKNENISDALSRELSEELGNVYTNDELDYFMTLIHYQKNYPKMEDVIVNRMVKTYYYIGTYKTINSGLQQLSEREKKAKFRLELISIDELEDVVLNNKTDNPRNKYFQDELLEVLKNYKKNKVLILK